VKLSWGRKLKEILKNIYRLNTVSHSNYKLQFIILYCGLAFTSDVTDRIPNPDVRA
jgi:hypothetical protein